MLNTAQILAKYKRNAANAVNDYQAGIQAVTQSPTAKAAQNVDKYARGVQDAVASGKYVNACNAVTLQDWQNSCLQKGVRNYTTGINNLSAKATKNMADQQTFAQQVSQRIQAMPNQTQADAENRMLEAMRMMRSYGKNV